MRKLSFVLVVLLLGGVAYAQQDPWQYPLSQYGVSPGVTYGSVAPSVATIGRPPAPGELWVDTNGAADGGAALFVYNATAAAFQSPGSQIGPGDFIIFEGDTVDAFDTRLGVVDPTVGTGTFLLPNQGVAAANYSVAFSTLATNALGAADSVWFGTNQLVFESTVVDGFEYVFQPAALTGDVTVTLPSDNADWAGTASPMYSVFLTNAPDIANGVWGVSNGIHYEGATADGFENSLQSDDPTVADGVFDLPNNAAAGPFNVMFSDLDTNALDVANSVWGTSNGVVYEGASVDTEETILIAQDPTVDVIYQMSNKGVAGTFNLLDAGQPQAVTVELPDRESATAVPSSPMYKAWFRTQPVYTVGVPVTAGNATVCSTTGNPNWIFGPAIIGYGFEIDSKATNTACGNTYAAADGMKLSNDGTTNDGVELTQGIIDGAPGAFTIGTSPAFYGRVRFAIGVVVNTDQVYFGFRLAQAYEDAAMGNYTDSYTIGVGDLADGGPGDWMNRTILNGAGAVNTDLAEADWTNDQVHTIEVQVSAAGAATGIIEGGACGDCPGYTFDNGDVVVPYLWMLADITGADPVLDVVFWETGIQ